MLTNSQRRRRTLTGSAHQLLRAPGTHIASGKDTLRAGLEIDTGHDKALSIQLRNIFEMFAVWRETNEDENAWDVEFLCLTCLHVFSNNRCQMIVFTFEFNDLCI